MGSRKGILSLYTIKKGGGDLRWGGGLEGKKKNNAKKYPREDRLKYEILLLSVNPRFEELKIDSNDELVEQIMKAVLQNYRLN